ncbi:MAG: phage holin family protein [Acidobacteriota bacterium]
MAEQEQRDGSVGRGAPTDRQGWAELFRGLGDALLDVLKAQMAVLGEDWARALKRYGVSIGLFAVAFVLLLATVPVVVFALLALIQELTQWPWSASAALAIAVTLLIIAALGAIGYVLIKRTTNPVAAFQQRLAEHLAWWQAKVAVSTNAEPTSAPAEGDRNEGDHHG